MDLGSNDDPTIPDQTVLWRRIPPHHVEPDNKRGGRMVSSAAFRNGGGGEPMSAYLADVVGDPALTLAGHEGYGLVAFTAGLARELGQGVVHDVEGGGPGHVAVVGNKTHGVRKRLRAGCAWVFRPPGWDDVALY